LSDVRNEGAMPFETGNLQNESTHVDDSQVKQGVVKIVSDTPYARRLYHHPEYSFNRSKNASAGGQWWEPYLSGSKRKLPAKLFKQFYQRLNGGLLKR